MRSPLRVFALVLAAVLATPIVGATPAAAYPSSHIEFEGHGWGHGRGLGQYGALGYANNHGWTYDRIVQHY